MMTSPHPDFAATTHDTSSVAATDPLISARAVVADFIHYPDHRVIEACGSVIAESPDQAERQEAALLMNFIEGCRK